MCVPVFRCFNDHFLAYWVHTLSFLVMYSFLGKMEYSLHSWQLLSVYYFRIFFLKVFSTVCLILSCQICDFCFLSSSLTVPNPRVFRLSYMGIVHAMFFFFFFFFFFFPFFFYVLSCYIIRFVLLWVDFLKFLTVWSSVESVWCWCVLTICISGSSLLSTCSISFINSAVLAPSICIIPLPPSSLGTYKRSVSALRWCYLWMVKISLFHCQLCVFLVDAS